jgi:hypothetical protein
MYLSEARETLVFVKATPGMGPESGKQDWLARARPMVGPAGFEPTIRQMSSTEVHDRPKLLAIS